MRYSFTLLMMFILLSATSANLKAEVPRELVRLEKLDRIVDGTVIPEDSKFYVLAIFKACCTPNEQAIDWMSKTCETNLDSVTFIGLNADRPRHLSKVKNWLLSRQVAFTVYSDPSGQMAAELKTFAPPSIIIFNGSGKEVYRTLGFRPNDKQKLEEILGITSTKE